MRVLLVEDDRELADYVRRALEEEHYAVTACFDGSSGLKAIQTATFDILVLDVMLPTLDGFQLTRRARLEGVQAPILFLTGRDAPEDIVRGLDAGGDDYLTKPFSLAVLLARIRARTRPADSARSDYFRFADLTIDFAGRNVARAGHDLKLTKTEFAILECLADPPAGSSRVSGCSTRSGAIAKSAATTSRSSSDFCGARSTCRATRS